MSERRGKTSHWVTCSLNHMRVLYLCESNCGLATIRNDDFPQKKILKLELSEGLDDYFFFWGGGGVVTWFSGGPEGD